MSLRTIFTAVEEQIAADMDPEPAPKFLFGQAQLFSAGAPPRIVWVPTREEYGPPKSATDGVTNPRPLHTRNVQVEAHIWGRDTDEAERLLEIVARALHTLAWGPGRILSGHWDVGGDAKTVKGEVYVMTLLCERPVTRAPDETAIVNAMAIEPLTIVEQV
jgi:hypothetical protein